MRRTLSGSRCRPLGGFRLLILSVLGAIVAVTTTATVRAQAPKAPAPPDTRPLARYIPREGLIFYLGTDGLLAQDEAWKKTAAYKLLNETNLGVMLEDMVSQFAEYRLAATPNRKLSGADVLTIIKHMAKAGFVVAFNGTTGPRLTIVFRGGASKEVRGPFARMLGTIWGTNVPKQVKKGSRAVIVVPMSGPSKGQWSWWSEGNDLMIAVGKGTEDVLISTIDGKTPSALDHPARAESRDPRGGFLPVGQMFLDVQAMPKEMVPAGVDPNNPAAKAIRGLMSSGLTRIDYRWGFQDDALMVVTRLKAPKPRRGLLAMFDQPAFDKGQLPPLPEGIESFTVVAADMDTVYDQLMASNDPKLKADLTQLAETIKTRSRVDLRKDLLARLGTKFAFYVMPGGTTTAPTAAPTATAPGVMAFLGLRQVPRFTLVAEVDDNVAFGKMLDSVMIALNKEMRERIYAAAEHAPKPAAAPGSEAGGDAQKEDREPPPVPEFRPTPSRDPAEKSYVLNMPSSLTRRLPAGFRPTIRLLNKQLVFSTTPDAARQALEVKAGIWTPPADLAPAFDQLPKELIMLGARDSRATLPEILAALPGSIQRAVNTLGTVLQQCAAAAAGGAVPGAAGPAGMPPPGQPGPAPDGSQVRTAMLVFNIPETRMPKPDEIRERLFPGSFAVSTDEQEVRFVLRHAFPNIIDPSIYTAAIGAIPTIAAQQRAQQAAAAAEEAGAKTKSGRPGPATKGGGSRIIPKD